MFLLLKRENFEMEDDEDEDEDEDGVADIQDDGLSVGDTNMGDPMNDPAEMGEEDIMDMDPAEMNMDEADMDMDMGEESFQSAGAQWPQVGSLM